MIFFLFSGVGREREREREKISKHQKGKGDHCVPLPCCPHHALFFQIYSHVSSSRRICAAAFLALCRGRGWRGANCCHAVVVGGQGRCESKIEVCEKEKEKRREKRKRRRIKRKGATCTPSSSSSPCSYLGPTGRASNISAAASQIFLHQRSSRFCAQVSSTPLFVHFVYLLLDLPPLFLSCVIHN